VKITSVDLFRRFIIRALAKQRGRTLVAILGVALGVAVMVAIHQANVGVTQSFRTAVESVSGTADFQIVAVGGGRFNERQLADAEWLHSFGDVAPVVEDYAMVVDSIVDDASTLPRGELLHVLGVDVLRDSPFRDYQILQLGHGTRPSPRELFQLLRDPTAMIITEKFAKRKNLEIGDELELAFGSKTGRFHIRGLLLDTGPARTLDGNFALMDVAAAQVAMGRIGRLDRVEIALSPRFRRKAAQTRNEIAKRLSRQLMLETPSDRYGRTETMIEAFQFNLAALSSVALVVGMFLIFNTINISVVSRRQEIATLRAVGAGSRTIASLFLGEALMIGILGIAVGVPLGGLAASAAVGATANTVEAFYIAAAAESAGGQQISVSTVLLVVGLVLPMVLVAAWIPARRACRISPVENLRSTIDGESTATRSMTLAWIGLLLLASGGIACTMPPVHGLPIWGFIGAAAVMFGVACFTPLTIQTICRLARFTINKVRPPASWEWRLAAANLGTSSDRLAIGVASLAVSLGMMFSIAIMVSSFRQTVVYWLDQTLSADLSVKPVMQTSAVSRAAIDGEVLTKLEQHPDVRAITWFSTQPFTFRDRQIRLASCPMEKNLRHTPLVYKESLGDDLPSLFADGNVNYSLVSESLSLRFSLRPGDEFTLVTPQGPLRLKLAATYFDYASNQGTVIIDDLLVRKHFPSSVATPDALSIYLKDGARAGQVREELRELAGANQQLYFVTNDEVRTEAMRIFDSTFTITYALELIAVIVAGLGVASTIMTLTYDRMVELATLDLLGTPQHRVRRIIVFEAILLGGISQLLGMVIGTLLACVLIYVINVQSFGWTIRFHFPIAILSAATLGAIAIAAIFGLYPARVVQKTDSLTVVR
jgi:putative ABC transport system permease protein